MSWMPPLVLVWPLVFMDALRVPRASAVARLRPFGSPALTTARRDGMLHATRGLYNMPTIPSPGSAVQSHATYGAASTFGIGRTDARLGRHAARIPQTTQQTVTTAVQTHGDYNTWK